VKILKEQLTNAETTRDYNFDKIFENIDLDYEFNILEIEFKNYI
jgi:hypothetical protein